MKTKLIIAAFLILFTVSTASAIPLSFEDTFGPNNNGDPAFNVLLSQFDPSLGTLTSVLLELEATTIGGTIIWDNNSAVPSAIDLGIGYKVYGDAPNATVLVTNPMQLGSGTVTADTDSGNADFTGTDSFTLTGGFGSDTDSQYVPTTGFAPYIGLGNFVTVITNTIATLVISDGGSGVIRTDDGTFSGKVKVTYDYTSNNVVPEPAAMLLFGAGMLGIAGVQRRRNNK